ncbi:MAG: hypothetical protein ACXVCE_18305, partial [Bacteriovorax sp.]
MKANKLSLYGSITLLIAASLLSCKKEIKGSSAQEISPSDAMGKQPLDPGFADNDMVLYWNDKVA